MRTLVNIDNVYFQEDHFDFIRNCTERTAQSNSSAEDVAAGLIFLSSFFCSTPFSFDPGESQNGENQDRRQMAKIKVFAELTANNFFCINEDSSPRSRDLTNSTLNKMQLKPAL